MNLKIYSFIFIMWILILIGGGLMTVVIGPFSIGSIGDIDPIVKNIVEDSRVALVSATGSTVMGKKVAQSVASRLGKSILELGGNNAVILSEYTNLKLAIPAFSISITRHEKR